MEIFLQVWTKFLGQTKSCKTRFSTNLFLFPNFVLFSSFNPKSRSNLGLFATGAHFVALQLQFSPAMIFSSSIFLHFLKIIIDTYIGILVSKLCKSGSCVSILVSCCQQGEIMFLQKKLMMHTCKDKLLLQLVLEKF